jgi:hypothetical protein
LQDPDILYLHLWLEKLNHPNLQRFCAEGAELPHIYDSGAPTRSIIVPEPVSTSKKKNDPNVELVACFKEVQENRKRKAEAFELAASAATTAPCTSSSAAQSIHDLFKLADDADQRIQKLEECGQGGTPYHASLIEIRDKSTDKIKHLLN